MKKSAITHVALPGSRRVVLTGARAMGRVNPHAAVKVLLKLRRKKHLPPLTGRPKTIMTREELADGYGAAKADVDAVVKEFKRFGIQLESSNLATGGTATA